MALKDDKIKDLFSSKFNGFEIDVPPSVWGGIDDLLSKTPVVTSIASSKKVSVALRLGLVAIAVAASVAVGVFVIYTPQAMQIQPNMQVVEEVLPFPKKQKASSVDEESVSVVEEEGSRHGKVFAQANVAKPQTRQAQAASRKVETVTTTTTVETTTTVSVEESKTETKKKDKQVASTLAKDEALPLLKKKSSGSKMSFGLKTNAGILDSDVDNRGGELLFSNGDRSENFTDMLENENEEYELNHKQPISFGLTVSKNLSSRLSLETGLVYTYLSSKIKSNSAVNIKEEQEFGYLGIPINLNYNFFDLYKAKFYISLGVMMQKDIHGKYTSQLVGIEEGLSLARLFEDVWFAEPGYLKKNLSQSHWQFSTHLTVGAAYPIYQRLYLQAAIGGAYYFDANNEYRTIYSDRKFQLDLNLGLRINF